MKAILASTSPRRIELIKRIAGVETITFAPDVDEALEPICEPPVYVMRLARLKAESIFYKAGILTIGADTVVCSGGRILGKPSGLAEAADMLKSLCGKPHTVYTGICFIDDKKAVSSYEKTIVVFEDYNKRIIENYLESGEWAGKAGGYGIQDAALSGLIGDIKGDYDNVVGFPVKLAEKILEENF